jgi:hypothetical protein
MIASGAGASTEEEGEDEGAESDGDFSDQPGVSVDAHTFRCPGNASCAFPPGDEHGANATARTTYGTNQATMSAESGRDPQSEVDVRDHANAGSFWVDDWSFLVPPSALGMPVSLEFHVEGVWFNGPIVIWEAGVSDPSLPAGGGPEDPPPFLPLAGEIIALVHFENPQPTEPEDGLPPPPPVDLDGSIDTTFVLTFVPQSLHTYQISAGLTMRGGGQDEFDVRANFGSTAELVRVLVAPGVSFDSSADASYDVVVPEPRLSHLIGLGGAALALARRRQAA